MNRFVTIKDIAKELNISVSTVSRALRDTYDIKKETREKVLEVANALNYKPNFNAIGLVKRSSHNIAVILPSINNYYFSTVITGIQEIAYQHNYNIILYVTGDSAERELTVFSNLSMANLDGLLVSVSSASGEYGHFQEVIDNDIPVVFFDRVADQIKTSRIMQDDYNGAFAAVEHLLDSGYRKIAHIAGPEHLTFTQKRLSGYLDALEKYGIERKDRWIVHSGFSQEDGQKDALRLLDEAESPDAILAVNDRKAIGAMITLKERKIKIGKQIGVMGFTNDPVSAVVTPSLTTMAEPAFDVGKKSCELLLKHIHKKNFIAEEVILPCCLLIRDSTKRK